MIIFNKHYLGGRMRCSVSQHTDVLNPDLVLVCSEVCLFTVAGCCLLTFIWKSSLYLLTRQLDWQAFLCELFQSTHPVCVLVLSVVLRWRSKEPHALHTYWHRGLAAHLFLRLLRRVCCSDPDDAVLPAGPAESSTWGLHTCGLGSGQVHRGRGLALRSVHQVRKELTSCYDVLLLIAFNMLI